MNASPEALPPTLDSALQPARVILNPGPEFADEVRQFQGIPGLERAPGGRLWAVWYSGGDTECADNYLVLVTSKDDGETWSKPALVVDPVDSRVRAFDACLWLDPQNRLWLFWAQSLGDWDGRFGVWAMVTDNGHDATPTWSQPRWVSDGILMNKPTVAANGDWLLPVSLWTARGKQHNPPHFIDPRERTGAWVVISRDAGKSFEYLGMANRQEGRIFDEHMLVERRDGSWWMLTRVLKGIWENESTDGGRTWNSGRFSPIPHINSRFFIRRLHSGNLLLVRHNLDGKEGEDWPPRSHLTAYLSEDDGQTWLGGLLLDERVGVSYPDGTQMPDDTIHVIYDWNRTRDKHILLATFTEEDVRAGEWISPKARSRQLINQATAEGRDGPATETAQPERAALNAG